MSNALVLCAVVAISGCGNDVAVKTAQQASAPSPADIGQCTTPDQLVAPDEVLEPSPAHCVITGIDHNPQPQWPLQRIQVKVHAFTTSSGAGGFSSISELRSWAAGAIAAANQRAATNYEMNLWPPGGGPAYLQPNFSIEWVLDPETDVLLHQDDAAVSCPNVAVQELVAGEWKPVDPQPALPCTYSTGIDASAYATPNAFNIYIPAVDPVWLASFAPYHDPANGKRVQIISGGYSAYFNSYMMLAGMWQPYGQTPLGVGSASHTISHEAGHAFGLEHAWENDGCRDTPTHPPNVWGSKPIDSATHQLTADGQGDLAYNNLMDYTHRIDQVGLTACQLRKIHTWFIDGQPDYLLKPQDCAAPLAPAISTNFQQGVGLTIEDTATDATGWIWTVSLPNDNVAYRSGEKRFVLPAWLEGETLTICLRSFVDGPTSYCLSDKTCTTITVPTAPACDPAIDPGFSLNAGSKEIEVDAPPMGSAVAFWTVSSQEDSVSPSDECALEPSFPYSPDGPPVVWGDTVTICRTIWPGGCKSTTCETLTIDAVEQCSAPAPSSAFSHSYHTPSPWCFFDCTFSPLVRLEPTATNQPEPLYVYYWKWSSAAETLHQEGLPGTFRFEPGRTYTACSRVYQRIEKCLSAETCQTVGTETCLTPSLEATQYGPSGETPSRRIQASLLGVPLTNAAFAALTATIDGSPVNIYVDAGGGTQMLTDGDLSLGPHTFCVGLATNTDMLCAGTWCKTVEISWAMIKVTKKRIGALGSLTYAFAGFANFGGQPSNETLSWKFGDGTTAAGSWTTDPADFPTSIFFDPIQHTYAAAGTYTVCAKLSNGTDATEKCVEVKVGASEHVSVGKISRLSAGFGVITTQNYEELSFYPWDVVPGESVFLGQEVSYERDGLRATQVTLVE